VKTKERSEKSRLAIATDDFDYVPFVQHGGLGKARQVFGQNLGPLLNELNEVLAAWGHPSWVH
jgi:type I restriction enzyme R subunit